MHVTRGEILVFTVERRSYSGSDFRKVDGQRFVSGKLLPSTWRLGSSYSRSHFPYETRQKFASSALKGKRFQNNAKFLFAYSSLFPSKFCQEMQFCDEVGSQARYEHGANEGLLFAGDFLPEIVRTPSFPVWLPPRIN